MTNKKKSKLSQTSAAESPQLSSTHQTVFRRVLVTDPDETAALWARVRGAKPAKKRGGGRGRGRGRGGRVEEGQQNVPQGDEIEELEDQTAILTVDDDGQSKTTRITVHSGNFESLVLLPWKIFEEENHNEITDDAFPHFGTSPPPEGDIEGLDAAEVWLSFSNAQVDRISEEYQFMKNKRVCKQEYALFAMDTFFRRQSRCLVTPTDRKWRAERMTQLFVPPTEEPKNSFWIMPPSFEASKKFKFDLRPDCSYWLSLAGFDPEYRCELGNAMYVHDDDWITCPYFTIEFKKHGQSIDQATRQASAAASIALYNRYLLKNKALAVRAESWTNVDRAQMKHYMMTFVGAKYTVLVLRARYKDLSTWDGCSIMSICKSTSITSPGVRKLEGWINEIHRWGLTAHAAGCQADAKTILQHKRIRTSAIQPDATG